MMNPKTLISVTLPLVLAGCAATYSDALKRYQRNEPSAFHTRTLEWTSATTTERPMARPRVSASAEFETRAATAPQTMEIEVLRAVLGQDVKHLAARLKTLQREQTQQAALRDTVTWNELALLVALRNPTVRAAAQQWHATLYQYSQAEYLETLIGQYHSFTRYLDVGAGKPFNKDMTKRYLPYPSTLSYKGELIAEQTRLARLEWETALREALIEAGHRFYLYQYLVRAKATTRDNIALIEGLLGVVEQRYEAGEASQADLLKLQTTLERHRNMLEDLRDRQASTMAELNELLDRPLEAGFGAPSMHDLDASVASESDLVRIALEHRQEVRAQESRVARTQIAIRMGEVLHRPIADQGYSRFEPSLQPETPGGHASMPYGQRRKVQEAPAFAQSEAYLSEMRQRLAAQQSMLEQVRGKTLAMTRTWHRDLAVARRRAHLVRAIVLPQNRSAYETLQSSYSAGRSSFIDLLDAERALLDARLELDAARRDLNQTIIRRATVTGRVPLQNERTPPSEASGRRNH